MSPSACPTIPFFMDSRNSGLPLLAIFKPLISFSKGGGFLLVPEEGSRSYCHPHSYSIDAFENGIS